MESKKKIAVAGATGRVGHHVVDVLDEHGHDVVRISRSNGVDVISGDGLADALAGVEVIVDAATGPSPDQDEATEFFTTAAENLQRFGERAGAQRVVVVSIIGTDRYLGGYGAAKVAHERTHQAGPVPVRIVRAAQFHEFVPLLLDWGRRGEVSQVPKMRTQVVAARTVAETVADVATSPESGDAAGATDAPIVEVAGPREELLVELASLYAASTGDSVRVEEVSDPDDPNRELNENGGLLPGPGATLAGPTFEEWLSAERPAG
jgi:uncharacterized protein YbjT (DUF2867 family)